MPFFSCCSSNNATYSEDEPVQAKQVKPVKPTVIEESVSKPYSPDQAIALFDTYVDPDTVGSNEPAIGPEGFQQLCSDAQIPMEGAMPLVLAWILDGKEMAKIEKNDWVKGMSALQISSLPALSIALNDLESLLILDKAPIKRSSSTTSPAKKIGSKAKDKGEPYNRDQYWSYAADKQSAFSKLYGFCFVLAKPEQARNIDMETATALWSVILAPRYPIMKDVIEYITEKGTYKGANKDLWNMMLEFCQTVKPSLDDYEADGAWPTLLDDFVLWKKSKTGNGSAAAETED